MTKPTVYPKIDMSATTKSHGDCTKVVDVQNIELTESPSSHDHPDYNNALRPPSWIAALSPAERQDLEKKLKRKIDWRLMPAVLIMYFLNYIDRNNIAAAKLANLERDLNLSSVQYQTSVSILFVGYLLMQLPSNLFLNKFGKPAIYLPCCMIVWGTISAATSACTSVTGLYVLGLRTAILYSGSLLSGAFSGLITAGVVSGLDGARGFHAWQWLFILEGSATIFVAFAFAGGWRLQEDVGMDDWVGAEKQTFWQGAKMAFTDFRTYVLMVLLFCIVASGTVTNFFPTVVQTLGYSRIHSLLLTAPPYVLAVIVTFANAWHADKTGERYFHIAVPMCVAIVAYIIAATTTHVAPRYLSMMLMVPSVYSSFVVAISWVSNTMPRPPAKRAAALAFINAVGSFSSIYASYLYPNSAAPHYTVAMVVNCVTAFVAVCAATAMRMILSRQNKKLARGEWVDGAINVEGFRFKL
ncbi:major facilitator superfamily domain-containing protein [Neurospora crassa]|nr:major facilitator superfamily domain-containing protein [Neurospora crassa]